MPTFGGNSVINGGEMTAVGAPQQKDAGIKNSLDLWMKDTVTAGLGLNQMDKAKELADNMMVCYEWLKNEMGVKFKPVITQDGGHSVPRSVVADNGSGSGFINPMHQKCEQAGVSLLAAELAEGSLAHDFPGNNCAVGLKVMSLGFPLLGSMPQPACSLAILSQYEIVDLPIEYCSTASEILFFQSYGFTAKCTGVFPLFLTASSASSESFPSGTKSEECRKGPVNTARFPHGM